MKPEFVVAQTGSIRLGVLQRLINRLAVGCDRLHVLEIGSYEGGSALAFSSFIGAVCARGGRVVCVDTWAPYMHQDDIATNNTCSEMEKELAAGTVFDRFLRNIKCAHENVPISFHIGTLLSALGAVAVFKEQFDLVYIDGSHAYNEVSNDIRLAKPLLRVGGIMCGDDLERQLHEVDEDFTVQNSHREYINDYHPGVTLAVARAFGHQVQCESGVWAVRKIDRDQWSLP